MLEVHQITRQYGAFTAVDQVSFTIDTGEIVGLLGHNGAGKTTIMKMISGYLEPNHGSITIDGIDLAKDPARVQQGLGYLPENLPIYPEMTVADYLDYSAALKGLKEPVKTTEIKRAIAATDIGAKLLDPIATLSRGYKQRVGVAQAILGQPKLLILDEPTNGLDPEQTQHMRQLIRDIAKEATVILSTHIMQEVDAICSRVLMLRAGELVVDAKLQALRQSDHLLLETSLPADAIQVMAGISGVKKVSFVDTQNVTGKKSPAITYRIALDSQVDWRPVVAAISKAVLDAHHDIYCLQPEQRDLETLFHEVNEGHFAVSSSAEGASHAA